jgi:hypothetical protein
MGCGKTVPGIPIGVPANFNDDGMSACLDPSVMGSSHVFDRL